MPCTAEVEALPQKDVMSSATTDIFTLNENVLARCVESKSNYFQEFCMFPPTQDLSSMCQDPPFDPQFLFNRMLDRELTSVFDLPVLISYARIASQGDWVRQQLAPVVDPNIVLNEQVTGHDEWFIGTTTIPKSTLPNPLPMDVTLARSQHQLMQLMYDGAFFLEFVNVPAMIIDRPERIVRLFDNGILRIYASQDEAQKNNAMWHSATNDQYGSDESFNTLTYPLVATASGTRATLTSPNGVYMLVITQDAVSIVFNSFNNPRFTASTIRNNNVAEAVSAQSQFCFQALNQNKPKLAGNPDLDFSDFRCNCIASNRLADRVYEPTSFNALPNDTRLFLHDTTPCILRECQLSPAEYSNANLFLNNKCIASNGFCQTTLPLNDKQTLFAVQDCMVSLQPCVTTADCPLGANCRNRQCMLTCTSDIPCIKANPLASCVNGQCVVEDITKQDDAFWLWFGVVVACCALFVLLILIVYFAMRI